MANNRDFLETVRDDCRQRARHNRLFSYFNYCTSVGAAAMTGYGLYLAESDLGGGLFFAAGGGAFAVASVGLARTSRRLSGEFTRLVQEFDRLFEQDDQDESRDLTN